MINWIAKKYINNDIVNKLFIEPLETNKFTNGGSNTILLENFIREKFKID
tara:strand:- start:423 stop:572 length:150 start_codon:yes stop_codon:yes gene_type:complete